MNHGSASATADTSRRLGGVAVERRGPASPVRRAQKSAPAPVSPVADSRTARPPSVRRQSVVGVDLEDQPVLVALDHDARRTSRGRARGRRGPVSRVTSSRVAGPRCTRTVEGRARGARPAPARRTSISRPSGAAYHHQQASRPLHHALGRSSSSQPAVVGVADQHPQALAAEQPEIAAAAGEQRVAADVAAGDLGVERAAHPHRRRQAAGVGGAGCHRCAGSGRGAGAPRGRGRR